MFIVGSCCHHYNAGSSIGKNIWNVQGAPDVKIKGENNNTANCFRQKSAA
jgi:hypothetical protein